jgi:hypothetical protein
VIANAAPASDARACAVGGCNPDWDDCVGGAPDGCETDADAQFRARRLHLSHSLDGTWYIDGCLDAVSGAIVADALHTIERDLFDADRADTGRGDDGHPRDLALTPAQRRADALVEMARRAGAVPGDARLPDPLFTVLVDYPTLAGRVCELADGTVVTPGTLVRWLDSAWVERVVFDGPDRVKNVGVRRRLFTGATAAPSKSATGSASTSSATSPPTAPKSTTSSPTPPAGSPPTTTAAPPAPTTTASDEPSRHDGGDPGAERQRRRRPRRRWVPARPDVPPRPRPGRTRAWERPRARDRPRATGRRRASGGRRGRR